MLHMHRCKCYQASARQIVLTRLRSRRMHMTMTSSTTLLSCMPVQRRAATMLGHSHRALRTESSKGTNLQNVGAQGRIVNQSEPFDKHECKSSLPQPGRWKLVCVEVAIPPTSSCTWPSHTPAMELTATQLTAVSSQHVLAACCA